MRPRSSRSPTNLRGMRVLVVDDVETSRLVLREILASWKFEVFEAASGEQALDILRRAKPEEAIELVLLDWKMPGMSGVEVARKIEEHVRNGEIPGMPVSIMVTAYSKEQLLHEARGLQLDAIVQKPVIASSLFDTIVRIQGGKVATRHVPVRNMATPLAGARILLVEDNEINQQVARELLESGGLRVTLANNGEEALQALETGIFDAVLMDLQMPVMDGLEATRRIRRDERFRDLPILAMTAAVMTQDRAACLDAGMNGHVAKPIVPQEMMDALATWIKPAAGGPECRVAAIARDAAQDMPALPGFDLDGALARVGGNRPLLEKLLQKFAEKFGHAADELEHLMRANRNREAAALLHQMRGSAGNLGAVPLQEAAGRLERELLAPGAQENAPPACREAFDAALGLALAGIAARRIPRAAEPADFECEKCHWQRGAELFKSLRRRLEDNDFVPPELLAELSDTVQCRALREKLSQLRRHIDGIDYGRALETLDSVTCAKGHDFGGR